MSQKTLDQQLFKSLLTKCDDGHAQETVDQKLFGLLHGSLLNQWPTISWAVNCDDNCLTVSHPQKSNVSLYVGIHGGQAHVQSRVSEKSPRGYDWTSQKVFPNAQNIDPLLQEIGTFLSNTPKSR